MNGPEHYQEAERLIVAGRAVVEEIRAAVDDSHRRDELGKQAMGIWAQATAEATLALTAATALAPSHDRRAWHAVAGTSTPTADEK
jgi:hypothetical protein